MKIGANLRFVITIDAAIRFIIVMRSDKMVLYFPELRILTRACMSYHVVKRCWMITSTRPKGWTVMSYRVETRISFYICESW